VTLTGALPLAAVRFRCLSRVAAHRGVTTGDLWLHLRIAALNLRRLLRLGLAHTSQG